MSPTTDSSVCVVGLWVKAPGCQDQHEMKQNVYLNRDHIRELPDDRQYFQNLKKAHPSLKAALVDGIEEFDDSYFGVGEAEALYMDPQQRLLMQGVVHALEDAGISLDMVNRHHPAVFTAAWCYDYKDLLNPDQYMASGNSASVMCGRISYFFNSRGASVGVETACSSSLVALHLARQSILTGESEIAIVCGANHVGERSFLSLYNSHMVSPDGRLAAFDRSSNGFVRAESFTVAIVCSEKFATQHNLNVRCQVIGSAYNNDGKTASLTAPNPVAQYEVQVTAMKGIESDSIDLITCHGTGTKLGDQVELSAIQKSFKSDIRLTGPKSSLGHGEGASGLIGLFHSIFINQASIIPNQLHLSLPIELLQDKSICFVNEEVELNRTAISSYGFGGTNSCAIIENQKSRTPVQDETPYFMVLLLSVKSEEVLAKHIENYANYLEESSEDLKDILYTTNARRTFYDNRVAVVGKNRRELIHKLRTGDMIRNLEEDSLTVSFSSEYANSLSQYRILTTYSPELKQFVEENWKTAELVLSISYIQLLKEFGIKPNVISHCNGPTSLISALAAAGILKIEDALLVLRHIIHGREIKASLEGVAIQSGSIAVKKGKLSSKKFTVDDIVNAVQKQTNQESKNLISFAIGKTNVPDSTSPIQQFEYLFGSCFVSGLDVNMPFTFGKIVSTPPYPFIKRRFWPEFVEKKHEADEDDNVSEAVESIDPTTILENLRSVVRRFMPNLSSDEEHLLDSGELDSLSTIEMIEAIGAEFSLQMPFDILETHSNVAQISEYINENTQKKVSNKKSSSKDVNQGKDLSIGIVAADIRFPGVDDIQEFWDAMLTGRHMTKQMSNERKNLLGMSSDFQAGLLKSDISLFDNGFFSIPKDEAEWIDPQHRILLKCAWNSWEKAGFPDLQNSNLFVAVSANSEYRQMIENEVSELDDRLWMGTNHSMLAGRIAQMIGCKGRALVVDTTCSSVASAIELCQQSMELEGKEYGIVAATQLIQSEKWMKSLNTLLPKDFTKSFSVEAAGFIRSEAVGVFILKRLAKEDKPLIVLEKSLTVHCGAVVTPVISSLTELLAQAGEIDYLESHGTATSVGDSVEAMAYNQLTSADIPMSSIKAQFGHAEVASGLMQLCKVSRILNQSIIPAVSHNYLPIEHIRNNEKLRLPFVNEEKEVEKATVISFGITGTKTAILGTKPINHGQNADDPKAYHLLPITAKTKQSLKKMIQSLIEMLKVTNQSLQDIATALQMRKSQHKWKISIVAATHNETIRKFSEIKEIDPMTETERMRIPLKPFSVSEYSFETSFTDFKINYETFCERLRFTPYSNPTSRYHQIAVGFALLKCVIDQDHPGSIAVCGDGVLVAFAVLEVAAPHYINDLIHSQLNEDIRNVKGILRDIRIAHPVALLNHQGVPIENGRQAFDSISAATFTNLEKFPKDCILIGDAEHHNSRTLSTYQEYLEEINTKFMNGGAISTQGVVDPSILLPEYQFEEKPLWIKKIPKTVQEISQVPVTIEVPGTQLNVNIGSKEWSHVKNHVINGEVIVPGATSMRIISQLSGAKQVALQNIDFLNPIIPRTEELSFEIRKMDNSSMLNCNGTDAVYFEQAKVDGTSLVKKPVPRNETGFDSTDIYNRFSQSLLTYRDNFQMIESLRTGAGSGSVQFKKIDKLDILLDGALQSIAIGYYFEKMGEKHSFLPFNIGKVDILVPNLIGLGTLSANFTYNASSVFLNGNVTVYSEDQKPIVNIIGACFKRKESEADKVNKKKVSVTERKKSVGQKKSTVSEGMLRAKAVVIHWFEDVFGWNEIDETAGFFDIGLSSLQAVRLRNYLKESYASASATCVFDNPNIQQLSEYLADLELENLPEEVKEEEEIDEDEVELSRLSDCPIGVMAASCRLPAGISDPFEFWDLLKTGRNANSRIPANRIPSRNVLVRGQKYGSPLDGGNFLDWDVSQFDPAFFKISKSEAEMMDPQQRLLLECVQECIENSGVQDMSDTGVFVGLMEKEYTDLMESQTTILSMLGSMAAVIAGRVNYVFGAYGPSITVDTACSSSLVALEMAINSILDGRCQRAIVAGVNIILSEKGQGLRANGKMLSEHGMSLSFDSRASGYGRSDGCVVLMIEKCQSSFTYMGILRGINVNHGGRSVSLTAPNGAAHKMLLTDLIQTSSDRNVQYWEAHGTGTPLGDPIEVNTISSILSDIRVGSVKASLGHGEASAGTCGVLKLLLMLKYQYIPSLNHFHVINKDIQVRSLTFPVVGEDESQLRLGGISSFGVSGTNAAAIISKEPAAPTGLDLVPSSTLIVLSARNIASLMKLEKEVLDMMTDSSDTTVEIAAALANRNHLEQRIAYIIDRSGSLTVRQQSSSVNPRKSSKESQKTLVFEIGSSDHLKFELMTIESFRESFESLSGVRMKLEDKMAFAMCKFIQGIVLNKEIIPTTARSTIILLMALGHLDVSGGLVQLLDEVNDYNLQEKLRKLGINHEENELFTSVKEHKAKHPTSDSVDLICVNIDLNDLKSVFNVLGRLYINKHEIDWSVLYPQPETYVHLPNYPFNRQQIWFKEKEKVFEHYLVGTIQSSDEKSTVFENYLSKLRHQDLFNNPLDIGTAVEIADVAVRKSLGKAFVLQNMELKAVTLKKNGWLTTKVERKEVNQVRVVAAIDGTDFMSCTAKKINAVPVEASLDSFTKAEQGNHWFFKEIPSTITRINSGMDRMIVDSNLETSAYRSLFTVLADTAENRITVSDMAITSLDALSPVLYVSRNEKEGKMELDIISNGYLVMRFALTSEVPRKYSFIKLRSVEAKRSITQLSHFDRVLMTVQQAFNDVSETGDVIGHLDMDSSISTLGFKDDTIQKFKDRLRIKYSIHVATVLPAMTVNQIARSLVFGGVDDMEAFGARAELENTVSTAIIQTINPMTKLEDQESNRRNARKTAVISNGHLVEMNHLSTETAKVEEPAHLTPVKSTNLSDHLKSIEDKICAALIDILPEIAEDQMMEDDIEFLEIGMDSLSIVDFVNRLNQKYFPEANLSTTDIFDNPNVKSLAVHLGKTQHPEPSSANPEKFLEITKEVSKPVNHINTSSQTVEFKNKIISALKDIMTEEFTEDALETQGFIELGLDSLSLVDFVNRLNQKYFTELEISTSDIFDYPTLNTLAEYLTERVVQSQTAEVLPLKDEDISVTNEGAQYAVNNATSSKPIEQYKAKIKAALNDIMTEEFMEEAIEMQGFIELGMDSLSLVDFVNRLNQKYFTEFELSTSDIFDYPTVTSLAEHLAGLGNPDTTTNLAPLKTESQPLAKENDPNPGLAKVLENVILAVSDTLTDGEVANDEDTLRTGFMELGFDSLAIVDFVNRLGEKYFPGMAINTSDIFDNPNIQELAEFIYKKQNSQVENQVKSVDKSKKLSGTKSEKSAPMEPISLTDGYFFRESRVDHEFDLRLTNTPEKLKLMDKTGRILFEVGEAPLKLDQIQVPKTAVVMVDLEDNISSEILFLSLKNFVLALATAGSKIEFVMSTRSNQSNALAESFLKTVTAEKPELFSLRWTEHLQPVKIQVAPEFMIHGHWLITGGLAGIGFTVAKWMASCGADGLVLTSRRKPDAELQQVINEMEKKTRVTVVSADVTNYDQMKEAFKNMQFKLTGVIHSAGVLRDGKLERQSRVAFETVFNTKAHGYSVIDRLLDEFNHNPEHFIVMSSFTAACGNSGQANYGVANIYLDYQMRLRRQSGKAGTSILWGNWLDTGMAADERIHKILEKLGFIGFSNEEGVRYLQYAIEQKPEKMMAAKVNWSAILRNRPDIPRDYVIKINVTESEFENTSKIVSRHKIQTSELEPISVDDNDTEEIDDQSFEEKVLADFRNLASELLKMPHSKIKINKSFMDMGFSSYSLANFIQDVNKKYGIDINIATIYEHSTIQKLVEYLFENEMIAETEFDSELQEADAESQRMQDAPYYSDIVGLNVFYNDEASLKTAVDDILVGKPTSSDGTYYQQVTVHDAKELKEKMNNLKFELKERRLPGKVVMMFSGQGAQYPLMGRQLCEIYPVFKKVFHDCLATCNGYIHGPKKLIDIIYDPKNFKELQLTTHMQPIMFSFCYAAGMLWKSFGVEVDFYLGHSVGELVAVTLAGIMDLQDALRLIVARGQAMEKIAGRGALLAIDRRAADDCLRQFKVYIATVNSPKQIVLAGSKLELDKALQYVKANQMQATYVNTKYPFHSAMIEESDLEGLRKVLKTIKFKEATTPVVSNITGKLITSFDEEYLVRHTVSAVRFVDCVTTLLDKNVSVWLEAGPSSTLGSFLKRIIDPKEIMKHSILQTAKDKGSDAECLVKAAMELEQRGVAIDWPAIYLPSYTENDKDTFRFFPEISRSISITEPEALVLEDHKVRRKTVIPAAFQMYSVLEWLNQDPSGFKDSVVLKIVRFEKPWIMSENREATILREKHDLIKIQAGGQTVSSCKVDTVTGAPQSQFNVEEFQKECDIDVDVEEFYRLMYENGLEYSDKFRVLETIKRSGKKTISRGTVKSPYLWPLIDGAIHAVCINILCNRPDVYFIPANVGEIWMKTPISSPKESDEVLIMTELVSSNEKFMQVNSVLMINGEVVMEIRNGISVILESAKKSTLNGKVLHTDQEPRPGAANTKLKVQGPTQRPGTESTPQKPVDQKVTGAKVPEENHITELKIQEDQSKQNTKITPKLMETNVEPHMAKDQSDEQKKVPIAVQDQIVASDNIFMLPLYLCKSSEPRKEG